MATSAKGLLTSLLLVPLWHGGVRAEAMPVPQETPRLESEPAGAVYARFRNDLQAARKAKEPLAEFLTRWISGASEIELARVGQSSRSWAYFYERPMLYEAFQSDSTFDNRLGEILLPLQLVLQRMPALRADAPWQSLLARAQLDSGELDSALESARLAWALDPRLCADTCDAVLDAWLDTGMVPAPDRWPAIVLPAFYDTTSVECESVPESLQPEPFAWAIPIEELIGSVRGPNDRIRWLLRESWRDILRGCQRDGQWHLEHALDAEFSSFELAEAWRGLQEGIDVWPADADALIRLSFLGEALPLPAKECDFSADPTCQREFKPLTRDGVRGLVDNLRSASRSFNGLQICPAPADGREPFSLQTQRDLRAAVAALDALPLESALRQLPGVLEDRRWARMWADGVPDEISSLMAKIAREDAALAEHTLQLAESWLTSGTAMLQDSSSADELLALLLLRNDRPAEALDHLQRAQQTFASLDRAQRISQLRSGLLGANLDASLPQAQLPRPWILGERNSDRLVAESVPAERTFSTDGVQLFDVIYALGGAPAVGRRQLHAQWLPWLLKQPHAGDTLIAELKQAYGDAALRVILLTSIADLRLSPAPHLLFDQLELPLPDHYCADAACNDIRAVDRAWLTERLQAMLEPTASNL